MNKENIIRMAVDAGIIPWTKHEYVGGKNFSASDEGLDGDLASLIQFAALVASAEREACEALHDHEDVQAPIGNSSWGEAYQEGWAQGTAAYRDAIRARGQA